MRLFCIPYAGSGTAAYRGWAEEAQGFDAAFDVAYVQLPGRESRMREQPFTSVPALVESLVDGIADQLDRPYALYGHSLGGVIAFELARAVRQRSLPQPSHLFVSASRAPQLPSPYTPVRHLSDLALLEEVHRRYESVPAILMQDADLRQLLVPCLRADLSLLETYTYSEAAPLSCGITCFGGIQDRMVSRSALEPWRIHTTGDFELKMLEGNHLFLQTARTPLLAAVRSALTRKGELDARS
jgi:medium-chain acyl-[acyl-carrier-protein] hydrolase